MRPHSLHQRLSFRITFALLAALLAVGLPFFYFFNRFHEQQKIESLRRSSSELSRLLLIHLEKRMLEAQPHLLENDVLQLSSQSSAAAIMLLNRTEEVKVASENQMVGRRFTKSDSMCRICHEGSSTILPQTTVVDRNTETPVFRSVMLISNKPPCFGCYSSQEPINGVLVVDLPLAEAETQP